MKKLFKILAIAVISFFIILGIAGSIGWMYFKYEFLNFEKDYIEKVDIKEISKTGYSFLDRNTNGLLDIYEDGRKPVEERVEDLLDKMTIEEKIHLLKGSGLSSSLGKVDPGNGIPGAAGTIVPTPRLGLPSIILSDGPAGLRILPTRKNEDRTYYCTAFPIGTALSSTWNTDLVYQVGMAMGDEAREYGVDVILAPGVNIMRHPFCGRNFEYYSEDPLLTGFIGAAMVNGIESQGIGASVKHFVANNQETSRKVNDAIISERALREIYLKGFEIIVKQSQPWTIMSSYNKVNGTYVAESKKLLTNILREEWGFEGLVMSDWLGSQDASAMVRAGNDLVEPGTKKQWKDLKKAHGNSELSITNLDTSVKRILKVVLTSQKMKNTKVNENPDLEAHAKISRQSASEGMVLLKNNQTLPIKNKGEITLLGITAYNHIIGGTGSGDVNEAYSISLEEGLRNCGFRINEEAKKMFKVHERTHKKEFEKKEGIKAILDPPTPPEMKYTTAQIEKFASDSDLAIISIGRNSGEGGDRVEKDDFLLTFNEKSLIQNTCDVFHKLNKKVVVILNIGGVIETASWKDKPDAILLAWQGGQESGNAIADVLLGKVNPSGKLPMTFPIDLNDHASNLNFPLDGIPMSIKDFIFPPSAKQEAEKIRNQDYTIYEEGIYIGYRCFDKADLEVSYPFGFGLSYSQFSLQEPLISIEDDTIRISVMVQNKGQFAGKQVIQVYYTKPNSRIDRPIQELKAFAKTKEIASGKTEEINLEIPISELSFWDEKNDQWSLEKGLYHIKIGFSSRDTMILEEIEI